MHFAVLLGSDNSYTTPFEIPFWSEVLCGGGIWLAVPYSSGSREGRLPREVDFW